MNIEKEKIAIELLKGEENAEFSDCCKEKTLVHCISFGNY